MQEDSAKVSAPAAAGGRKPVILAVDDEPQVLNAVALDLRRRFRGDYRIMTAASGAEALDAIRKLRQRGDLVALFLVDQRMPAMTGVEFLNEARKVHPEAKQGAADRVRRHRGRDRQHQPGRAGSLPDEAVGSARAEALPRARRAARGLGARRCAPPGTASASSGTLWSSGSHEAKDFLARNRIPYRWLDLDRDAEARALAETSPPTRASCRCCSSPTAPCCRRRSRRDIAEKVGLRTQAAEKFYDLVVIGGGPAGLAAAVYGASEGLKTVLIEREATGGQAGTSSRIENYLGFPSGLTGADLAAAGDGAGAPLRRRAARGAGGGGAARERSVPHRRARRRQRARAATRWWSRPASRCARSRCPGAEQVTGAGLYYGAALTEAAHYRDRDVIVVGGANSAGQGAVFFSHYARRVTMLVRGQSLAESMSHYLVDQIAATPNIEVVPETEVLRGQGNRSARGVWSRAPATARPGRSPPRRCSCSSAPGRAPSSATASLARDPGGFIMTGLDLVRDGQGPPGLAAGPPARAARDERARDLRGRRRPPRLVEARRRRRRRGRGGGPAHSPVPEDGVAAMGYADFLRKVPLFAELPDADLQRLCSMIKEVNLAPRARRCSPRGIPARRPTSSPRGRSRS